MFKTGDRVRMTQAYIDTIRDEDRADYAGEYTVTSVKGDTVYFTNKDGDEVGCSAGWLALAIAKSKGV